MRHIHHSKVGLAASHALQVGPWHTDLVHGVVHSATASVHHNERLPSRHVKGGAVSQAGPAGRQRCRLRLQDENQGRRVLLLCDGACRQGVWLYQQAPCKASQWQPVSAICTEGGLWPHPGTAHADDGSPTPARLSKGRRAEIQWLTRPMQAAAIRQALMKSMTQPHSPTAPQPHSPTAPQPHSPTAPVTHLHQARPAGRVPHQRLGCLAPHGGHCEAPLHHVSVEGGAQGGAQVAADEPAGEGGMLALTGFDHQQRG
jgi:hypothetical protein